VPDTIRIAIDCLAVKSKVQSDRPAG